MKRGRCRCEGPQSRNDRSKSMNILTHLILREKKLNMTEIEKLKKEIEDLKLIIESKNNQVESKNKHIKRLERIISNIKKEQSQ